jgi:hypothetical protein
MRKRMKRPVSQLLALTCSVEYRIVLINLPAKQQQLSYEQKICKLSMFSHAPHYTVVPAQLVDSIREHKIQ